MTGGGIKWNGVTRVKCSIYWSFFLDFEHNVALGQVIKLFWVQLVLISTSKFFKDKKNCTGLKGKYNLYSLKNLQDSAYYTKLQETSWYFLSIMNMEKPH